jgi:putative flippase GtrA
MRDALRLIARFGLAGLVNTAVGFAVIVVLDLILNIPPPIANAGGYAVGVAVGFILNRSFVFRSRAALPSTGLRYAGAALAAFALNQAILHLAGSALGAGAPERLAAQLMAMAAYSVALFGFCRLWVFPRGATSTV